MEKLHFDKHVCGERIGPKKNCKAVTSNQNYLASLRFYDSNCLLEVIRGHQATDPNFLFIPFELFPGVHPSESLMLLPSSPKLFYKSYTEKKLL